METGKKKWWELFGEFLVQTSTDAKGEVRGFCPYHEDAHPSMYFNMQKEVAYCQACKASKNFYTIAKDIENDNGVFFPDEIDKQAALEQHASVRAEVEAMQPLVPELVDEWKTSLRNNYPAFKYLLNERGLFAETIEEFDIGWERKSHRYTIPVYHEGELVNVRRYRNDARTNKMWNWPGHGSPARLYPEANLTHDDILIVEGEWDALVATQYGIPAVTGTGGSNVWLEEWTPLFDGKNVTILYDNDKAGRDGATLVARNLIGVAASVKVATIPLEIDGADISDLFSLEMGVGFTQQGLKDIVDGAKPFRIVDDTPVMPEEVTEWDEVPTATVADVLSFKGEAAGLTGRVVARQDPPLMMPTIAQFDCNQDAGPAKCALCPMNTMDGHEVWNVPTNSPSVMEPLFDSRYKTEKTVQKMRGIPHDCKKVNVQLRDDVPVERLRLEEPLDAMTSAEKQNIYHGEIEAYNIGSDSTEVGDMVRLLGRVMPKSNKEAVFHSWKSERVSADFDEYHPTEDDASLLRRFVPNAGQTSLEKCLSLAEENALHVTRIYGRPDVHVAFDLVAHSVIEFYFEGATIGRGWLDGMVFGDTRTGKTQVCERLSKHYGGGVTYSCESASVAGLLGGVSNSRGSWQVTWGVIPMNDRKLVVLDEASGLIRGKGRYTTNLFSELSALRDSGVAQISKAATGSKRARTRKIWLSNPSDNLRMISSGSGVRAFAGLFDHDEDISRFDFVVGAFKEDEVPTPPQGRPQTATSTACHLLLKWAWSRKATDIIWMKGAEEAVRDASRLMSQKYTDEIPLIQKSNVHTKIARIAVALAVRTFSSDESFEKVLVTQEHVDSAVRFLDMVYGDDMFGYYAISEYERERQKKALQARESVKRVLLRNAAFVNVVANGKQYFRDQHAIGALFSDRTITIPGSTKVHTPVTYLVEHHYMKARGGEGFEVTPELIMLANELYNNRRKKWQSN